MKKVWLDGAWEEYLTWLEKDKKSFKKINQLIKSIERNGYQSLGKPEPLTGNFRGWWSVRINQQWRLIFRWNDGKVSAVKITDYH